MLGSLAYRSTFHFLSRENHRRRQSTFLKLISKLPKETDRRVFFEGPGKGSSMGCCFSGDKDAENQGVVNERSPLLSGDQSAPIPHNHRPGEDGIHGGSTPLSKTDEQSMLNKILHQTANKVIDVQSTEPHSLERTEYMERSRLYLSKMANVNMSQVPKGKHMPQGVNIPSAVLAADPVSIADIRLTISASKGAQASLSGFQIEHREPLVVAFGST